MDLIKEFVRLVLLCDLRKVTFFSLRLDFLNCTNVRVGPIALCAWMCVSVCDVWFCVWVCTHVTVRGRYWVPSLLFSTLVFCVDADAPSSAPHAYTASIWYTKSSLQSPRALKCFCSIHPSCQTTLKKSHVSLLFWVLFLWGGLKEQVRQYQCLTSHSFCLMEAYSPERLTMGVSNYPSLKHVSLLKTNKHQCKLFLNVQFVSI